MSSVAAAGMSVGVSDGAFAEISDGLADVGVGNSSMLELAAACSAASASAFLLKH